MFENVYIATRKIEHRVYSDDEVVALPRIAPSHEHYQEWKMREGSERRLFRYLKEKQKPLRILEVGCGNGWLSNRLSAIPFSDITGIDINGQELSQAERLFKANNLVFIQADISSEVLQGRLFDVILFAASIQYFSNIHEVLDACLLSLSTAGEIHILDTHFYPASEVLEARKRTAAYYRSIGSPEMSDHYFHHSLEDLARYDYKVFRNFSVLQSIVRSTRSPFPWICVTHKATEIASR